MSPSKFPQLQNRYFFSFFNSTNKEEDTCWNCKQPRHSVMRNLHCDNCKVLCPPPEYVCFFELMEQPFEYVIDKKAVSERYKKLQFILHPDRYTMKSKEEQMHSESWSPLVNEAYSILMDNMKRARYMLETVNVPLDDRGAEEMRIEFLDAMMEINYDIEEAQCKEDLDAVRFKTEETLKSMEAVFHETFEKGSELCFAEAKKIAFQMQYFHNIKDKVKEKEIELGIM